MLEYHERLLSAGDRLFSDDDLLDVGLRWNFENQVKHRIFENRTKSTCPKLTREGLLCDRTKRIICKAESNPFHLKKSLILLNESVFGPNENLHQSFFGEFSENSDDRESTDKLRDKPDFQKIFWLNVFQ